MRPECYFRSIAGWGWTKAFQGNQYRFGSTSLRIDVFNLFDSDDYNIAYFYASRLPGESLQGVEDIHFRPVEPRSVRASVTYHW